MAIPEHLLPSRFPRAEVERTLRFIRVKPGTTPEAVMDPDFWVHGSQQVEGSAGGSVLKVDDKIEVVAQDGTFDLELRVVAVDPRGYWAQMRLLRAWPRSIEEAFQKKIARSESVIAPRKWPDSDGYSIEWAGPHHRFRIVDRVGSVVDKGFSSESDAMVALDLVKKEKVAA